MKKMTRTYCEFAYLPKYCAAWLEGLATTLPDPARTLEIGTGSGCSLRATLLGLALHNDIHAWTVDITERPYLDDQMKANGIPKDRYTFIQAASQDAAKTWTVPLDMLYIDADHTYEGAKADILAWTLHLKFGGLLVLDDYECPWHDVTQIVDEVCFAKSSTWRFVGQVGRTIAFEKGTLHRRAPWLTDDMWKWDSHVKNKEGEKDPWLWWGWGFGLGSGEVVPYSYGKSPKKTYTEDLP